MSLGCLPSTGRDLTSSQLYARSVEKASPSPNSSRSSSKLPQQPQTCQIRRACKRQTRGGMYEHKRRSRVTQPDTQRRAWFRAAVYVTYGVVVFQAICFFASTDVRKLSRKLCSSPEREATGPFPPFRVLGKSMKMCKSPQAVIVGVQKSGRKGQWFK